jgi:hypothetical protein
MLRNLVLIAGRRLGQKREWEGYQKQDREFFFKRIAYASYRATACQRKGLPLSINAASAVQRTFQNAEVVSTCFG